MEDNATQSGSPLDPNLSPAEIAARLKALEEEHARLRALAAQASTTPVDLTSPQQEPVVEVEKEDEQEAPSQPTVAQIQEAEALIRQARLARTRGQASVAGSLLKQAEEIAPNSAVVLEAIGDDFFERRQFAKASEAYGKAVKIATNPALEKKHAESIYHSKGLGGLTTMASEFEVSASGKIAIVLSALIPGLGQIVLLQYVKGAIMAVIHIGAIIALGSRGFLELTALVTGKTGSEGATGVQFHPITIFFLAVLVINWLGSIIDASSVAKMSGSGGKGGRPKPPVDLPY